MAAPKGTMPPNAGKGREPGVPNKVSAGVREALHLLVEGNLDRMQGWIEQVAAKDPGKALDIVVKLAEFVVPKLSRTEIDGQLDTNTHQPHPFAAFQGREITSQEAADAYQRMMSGNDTRPFAPLPGDE